MQTRIQKSGHSLVLGIPESLAAEAWLEEGSAVELFVESGTLHVRPLRTHRYALRDLLRKAKPQNLQGEVSTGAPVGRERVPCAGIPSGRRRARNR